MDYTRHNYDRYRGYFAGSVPPVRGDAVAGVYNPGGGTYNPTHRTNAADYCVRKNRDYNGDGVISGDELKWYVPNTTQLVEISQRRGNLGFPEIGTPGYHYWANKETGATTAATVDFGEMFGTDYAHTVKTNVVKSGESRVRCVRDRGERRDTSVVAPPGEYVDPEELEVYVDLEDNVVINLSAISGSEIKTINSSNSKETTNVLGRYMQISRWYNLDGDGKLRPAQGAGDTSRGAAAMIGFNNGTNPCQYYTDNAGTMWTMPSLAELQQIYSKRGLINASLRELYGAPGTGGSHAYHEIIATDFHWSIYASGSGNGRSVLNFTDGTISVETVSNKDGTGYVRCVTYLSELPEVKPAPAS
jgi:hypothetical protein